MNQGWIGVDLDGTLARYDGWVSETHIGAPIPAMIERVRSWLEEGIEVRIVTARASPVTQVGRDVEKSIRLIQDWCERHVGARLAVTCSKDFAMVELWDDRCVQVETNTGRRLSGAEAEPGALPKIARAVRFGGEAQP